MLVAESHGAALFLHVDSVLWTVVQTGVADLALVRKDYLIFCHRDIVCRTYPGTDSAVDAGIIDDVALGRVLSQQTLADHVPEKGNLRFAFGGNSDSALLLCGKVRTKPFKLTLHILLRQGVHLISHLEAGQVVVHHLNGVTVFQIPAPLMGNQLHMFEGSAVAHTVGVDIEQVIGSDLCFVQKVPHHHGHLSGIDWGDDTHRIVLNLNVLLLHQLWDRQQCPTDAPRHI